METGALGKVYPNGNTIIRQGDEGECIYIIQEGKVEVFTIVEGQEIILAKLEEGDFFGEMAVFTQSVRSSSVRALGEARVLTVDKKTLFRTMQENPSLSFRFLQTMSTRIRGLGTQFAQLYTPREQASETENQEMNTTPNFVIFSG